MHLFEDDAAVRASSVREAELGPERTTADARAVGPRAEPATTPSLPPGPASLLHLQRRVGNSGVVQLLREGDDDPHKLRSVLGSGGSPLDSGTRVQMETAIGADFSGVRIHTGGDADASARSLGAHAYTAGDDVVFAEGRYDPGSTSGQRTLAHELTHVVQQRSGPVDGTMTDTGVRVSDPSDRFEQAAEANAERVVGGSSSAASPAAAPASADEEPAVQGLFVQREPEEEEMTAQGLFVQREPEEEEMTAQGLFVQREPEEEEMTAQGLFVQREPEEEEMTAQGLFVQREPEEEEMTAQGLFVQRDADGVQRMGEEDEDAG